MKLKVFYLLVLLSVSAKSQSSKIDTIKVEPFLKLTYGAFYKELSLAVYNSEIKQIYNFDFEWGYFYTLKIETEKIKNPQKDVSNTRYYLLKILNKTKVPVNFEFSLKLEKDLYLGPGEQNNTLTQINDTTFLYFNSIEIEVPQMLKDEFLKTYIKGKSQTGTFKFLNEKKIILIGLEE
jgi:hypothetical protein